MRVILKFTDDEGDEYDFGDTMILDFDEDVNKTPFYLAVREAANKTGVLYTESDGAGRA